MRVHTVYHLISPSILQFVLPEDSFICPKFAIHKDLHVRISLIKTYCLLRSSQIFHVETHGSIPACSTLKDHWAQGETK